MPQGNRRLLISFLTLLKRFDTFFYLCYLLVPAWNWRFNHATLTSTNLGPFTESMPLCWRKNWRLVARIRPLFTEVCVSKRKPCFSKCFSRLSCFRLPSCPNGSVLALNSLFMEFAPRKRPSLNTAPSQEQQLLPRSRLLQECAQNPKATLTSILCFLRGLDSSLAQTKAALADGAGPNLSCSALPVDINPSSYGTLEVVLSGIAKWLRSYCSPSLVSRSQSFR